MKKQKSRVKNIFIQKVNSSVSLEETRKVAQKRNKCGHPLKQFQKCLWRLECRLWGERRVILEEVLQRFWWRSMTARLSSVFLSLHPLVRELNGPSLSCGREAAGQSGCLSVTSCVVCPSALVSNVVVHGGWDAGHYSGASSCCKVACYSWTYRWQEDKW